MQKAVLILAVITAPLFTPAQLTGIGAPAPLAQLSVLGTSSTLPPLLVQNFGGQNLLAGYADGSLVVGNTTPAATLTVDGEPGSQHLFIRNSSNFQPCLLQFKNSPVLLTKRWQVSAFTFGVNASAQMVMDHSEFPGLVTLQGDGRVGLNNGSPAARLDVNGNLRFNNALLANGHSGNTGDLLVYNNLGQSQWVAADKYYYDLTQSFTINNAGFVENSPGFVSGNLASYSFIFNGGPAQLEYSLAGAVKGSCCATSYGYFEIYYTPPFGGVPSNTEQRQQFHFTVDDNKIRTVTGSSYFTLPASLSPGIYVMNCRLVWTGGPRIYTGSFYIPETATPDYFVTFKLYQ